MNELVHLLSLLPECERLEHHFDKGAVVFEQGDRCGGLWIVHTGRVDLQRVTESGHLVLIHRAHESEPFAEASLFSTQYHCTARAGRAETTLIEFAREPLLRALQEDSNFAVRLCAMLATQVQSYRRQVEVLSIRKADQRVLEALALGMLGDDVKGFAARIGLSHEVVYRALANLTEQGLIKKIARGQYAMARIHRGKSDE